MQGVFAAVSDWSAARMACASLEAVGLLAPPGSREARSVDVTAAEALMDAAHRVGVTGLGGAFERLAHAADGALRFVDLPQARRYPPGSVRFLAARDKDRIAFNRRFGTDLLTETAARRALAEHKAAVPAGYRDYAPIDFGGGLIIGQIASTDSGTGRWEFFNAHVVGPLVHGKRVLDLGSNNGSLPLMMLRAGAARVVGIEMTPALADFARLNAKILAWRDMRRYDITVLTGDMRMFLSEELGEFDVVTAFCSLYYLPEVDMARVIAKAAAMNAALILQANDAIDNLPAKHADLRRLMRDHGYGAITVYAPRGFSRPLIVGLPTPGRRREESGQ